MEADLRRGDPGQVRDELEPGVCPDETGQQRERGEERDERHRQRHAPYGLFPFPRHEQNEEKPHQRNEEHGVEEVHRTPPSTPSAISSETAPRSTQVA